MQLQDILQLAGLSFIRFSIFISSTFLTTSEPCWFFSRSARWFQLFRVTIVFGFCYTPNFRSLSRWNLRFGVFLESLIAFYELWRSVQLDFRVSYWNLKVFDHHEIVFYHRVTKIQSTHIKKLRIKGFRTNKINFHITHTGWVSCNGSYHELKYIYTQRMVPWINHASINVRQNINISIIASIELMYIPLAWVNILSFWWKSYVRKKFTNFFLINK